MLSRETNPLQFSWNWFPFLQLASINPLHVAGTVFGMLNLNHDVLILQGYRQKSQILPLSYKVMGQQPSNFQAFDDLRQTDNPLTPLFLFICSCVWSMWIDENLFLLLMTKCPALNSLLIWSTSWIYIFVSILLV